MYLGCFIVDTIILFSYKFRLDELKVGELVNEKLAGWIGTSLREAS